MHITLASKPVLLSTEEQCDTCLNGTTMDALQYQLSGGERVNA